MKEEDWSRGDIIHRVSQKEDVLFELYLSRGKWSVIGFASAKWFLSMDVPRKLVQMAMSRARHFRRVGAFRSTARAFALKNASRAGIPLLSSQVTEYSMHDELRMRECL